MRSVVVTGGGTGIGREVAAQFAAEGCDVVITGRREDVLQKAADEIASSSNTFREVAAREAATAQRDERILAGLSVVSPATLGPL
jgi:short-subunit dehydrogenase involved in D-alanine esterification of teichoic acids